jgi:hypothetical protein
MFFGGLGGAFIINIGAVCDTRSSITSATILESSVTHRPGAAHHNEEFDH